MITFNTTNRNSDEEVFGTVSSWLGALYTTHNFDLSRSFSISSLNTLQENIDYKFENINLLITALTHKTFFIENKNIIESDNEKLEFLGDSILNYLVSHYLFKNFPELNEGELSKLRTSLVNEHSFATLARSINLQDNLFIGKGEFKNNGNLKDSLLADSFEALFGAMSMEIDPIKLMKIFQAIVENYQEKSKTVFIDVDAINSYDSKTKLQELVMEKFNTIPVYKFHEDKNAFEVELWIADKMIGKKSGLSKKKLEKELAKFAIENNLI
jgi:ribonuclease-3